MLGGCPSTTSPDVHDDNEVVTTVELTFTPEGGGDAVLFTWADPEDDGDPVVDAIALVEGVSYDVSVAFFNELEDPAEDLTDEIYDESDEHQVFFTGDAVQGPATGVVADAVLAHSYADMDSSDLPVGLQNTMDAVAVGTGELVVTLRHLPTEGNAVVKVPGLAEDVAAGGFAAIGGDNDAQMAFPVEVVASTQ